VLSGWGNAPKPGRRYLCVSIYVETRVWLNIFDRVKGQRYIYDENLCDYILNYYKNIFGCRH